MKRECPTNYLAVISLDRYKTHCSPLLWSAALKGICLFVKWKARNRKHFYCYTKWFIWERHRDVISIPVKGSRASGSYEICLKPTMKKKIAVSIRKKTTKKNKWRNPATLSMWSQTAIYFSFFFSSLIKSIWRQSFHLVSRIVGH